MSEETRPYSPGAKSPGEGWFLENKETRRAVTRAQKARANSDGVFKQDGMNVDASVALEWRKGRVVGETRKGEQTRKIKEAKEKNAEEKARKKQVGRKAATRLALRRGSLIGRIERLKRNQTRNRFEARRRSLPFSVSSQRLTAKKPRKLSRKEVEALSEAQAALEENRIMNEAAHLRTMIEALETRATAVRIEAERARREKGILDEAKQIMKKAKSKKEYNYDSEDENENNAAKSGALTAIPEENYREVTEAELNAVSKLADVLAKKDIFR